MKLYFTGKLNSSWATSGEIQIYNYGDPSGSTWNQRIGKVNSTSNKTFSSDSFTHVGNIKNEADIAMTVYGPTLGMTISNMYLRVTYTLKTYTISVTSNGNGTVSGGGSGLTKGTTATISATPNEGYVFAYWSDGNRNASRTITVSGNTTYTATFVPKLSVTRSTYIQNGTDGYYVYTYIEDTGNGIGRVQFPTWTNPEQDDIQPNWSTNTAASGTAGSWTIDNLLYNYLKISLDIFFHNHLNN